MSPTTVPDIVERIMRGDPRELARAMGAARTAIGATALMAPARITRRWLSDGRLSPAATTAMRMAAGRDLVLGLGTVLAARHDSSTLRGWVGLSGLADAIDAYAFLRDDAFRPLPRAAAVLASTGATITSVWLARRHAG